MATLLETGLSDKGYQKTEGIRSLEPILHENREGEGPVRDSDLCFVSISGTPSADRPLTGAFRRCRQMKDDTANARIEKRQLEQSILFIAGVLAHWVTDVSQPMHCSVHILGWHPPRP